MRHVAVPVGGAFPDAHRREMRRLQRRDVPLVDAVVGDAVEADLAVRPGLHAGPFDAVVEVLRLARREVIDEARRAAAAARVDAHAGVAVRHPFLGIDHFPVLVVVARAGGDVGMLGRPCAARRSGSRPGTRGPWRRGRRSGAPGSLPSLDRAKHVGAQHEAVVHRDRHVPVDAHAVADFAAMLVGLAARSRGARIFDRSHSHPPAALLSPPCGRSSSRSSELGAPCPPIIWYGPRHHNFCRQSRQGAAEAHERRPRPTRRKGGGP